jgi:autoinducer 2 (AI-2) kinase
MQQYLMAIDAGTGSVRAVIFDTDGEQIAVAQREWTHRAEDGVPGSMAFDWTANWALTTACIREALERSGIRGEQIMAVSATSMREGIVLYDADGREVWAVANVDARADAQVRYLHEHFPELEAEYYAQSGQTFALGALPRLLWLRENRPERYDQVKRISMIGDWILARLSGVIATDPSNGGTTGIFSLEARDWVPKMAAQVGLRDDIFPPTLEPGTVMGTVMPDVAAETGLSNQTLVVMGGGDVQLGAAGLGVVGAGDAAILGGSFWQQVVNIPSTTPPPDDRSIRVNPHVISGLSQAEGITFFSGLVMRWFRDAFCRAEQEEANRKGVDVYALLDEKAAAVPPGAYGILPIFSDSMKYGRWYHAAPGFLNLSLDPERANTVTLYRSLLENAALVSAINLEKIVAFAGVEIERIVFAGGASQSPLWAQIVADITGYEIAIPRVTEATALGAAMAAGVGAGIYRDMVSASEKLVQWERTYTPSSENKVAYETLRNRWEVAYAKQLELVDEGITEAMWRAPGL